MRSSLLYHIDYKTWNRRILFPAIVLFLVILPALVCQAQSSMEPLDITLDGKLWIEGEAGMFNYECNIQQLSQASHIASAEKIRATIADSQNVGLAFTIPVTSFSCNKKPITENLYEALKYQSHPTISFQLMEATPEKEISDSIPSSWISINTHGIMEMAGVQEHTDFPIQGKILGDQRYQVKGRKKINMDTYSIEPPSTMGGLVTADKVLSVYFDVVVKVKNPPNK